MIPEFVSFGKIPRLSRECVVTEKIDGTNASILITEDGDIVAGSRTRWITPEDDNFGFAAWVREHRDELLGLGVGLHYGEWWGRGIQRGYGLSDRRFSLFNTKRWLDDSVRPSICSVVPVVYSGIFSTTAIEAALEDLKVNGSYASRGFMKPEGVVVYHVAGNLMFKKTIEKDEEHKGTAR